MDFFADVMSLKDDRLLKKHGGVLDETRPRFLKTPWCRKKQVV